MNVAQLKFSHLSKRIAPLSLERGMTLIEVLISFAILVITTVGSVSSFVMLNKYAENLSDLSVARALCQERIEQAMTLSYRPADVTPAFPSAPSSDPNNTTPCNLLGKPANYTSGVYSGGNNLQTSSESISIYTQTEGTAANQSANVTFTRTTTVSPAGLYSIANTGSATTTSLNVLQFTVTVSYVFRGNTYNASMSTLRSPD